MNQFGRIAVWLKYQMKPSKSPKEYSLDDAVWRFASRSMQQEFNEASGADFPTIEIAEQNDRVEQAREFFSGLQVITQHLSNRVGIWARMREHLFALLRAEKLTAVGVRVKPTLGSGRETVPPFLFDKPKANLKAGTIENFGHRFEAIRMLARQSNIPATPVTQAAPTPTGRPSKATEIAKAIDALTSDGVNLTIIPRKEAYSLIRRKAETLGVNAVIGFSDPVIQRVLHRRYGPRA